MIDDIFGNGYLNDINIGGEQGMSKEGVDSSLQHTIYSTSIKCIACGNSAIYKLIAKDKNLDTAQLNDKGYVCGHCVTQYPTTSYKLKDLRE